MNPKEHHHIEEHCSGKNLFHEDDKDLTFKQGIPEGLEAFADADFAWGFEK